MTKVCVCVCVCVCAQLYLTLCNPIDCSPPGSFVHGSFFQARILEWVANSSSRGSSRPKDQTHVSCTGRQILYHYAIWEALDKGEKGLILVQWNQSGMKRCPEPSNIGKLLLLLGLKGLPEPGNNRLQGVAQRSREGAGRNKDTCSLSVSLLVFYENSLANPTRGPRTKKPVDTNLQPPGA